jgi:hypothetical protein
VTQSEVKNLAASVRARLANLARSQKEDFQELLSGYARERLLYRLSVSDYQEGFVLKGSTPVRLLDRSTTPADS